MWADVLDILQKSLHDGEVVGPSWPRGRLRGPGLVGSQLSILDSSTPFRLSDPWRALAPLASRGPVATGDGGGGDHRLRSGVLEGIAGRP